MTLKTTTKKLAVEEVPAVQDFLHAQNELYQFMQQHQQIFDRYVVLAEQYNNTLEAADKDLRARCEQDLCGISCGPFDFKHFATKYDADSLLEQVGEQTFREWGGTTVSVPTNKVDPKMMESLITRGAIPVDLQRTFVKRAANYDKPKKVGLP